MSYVSIAEVRATAQSMTANAQPSASDDLVRDLIERASRMFDRECGVVDEYFESAFYPEWESAHAYIVGEIVAPTTANSHIYRVTTAGTSGTTEPTWPTGSGATVSNGSVVFTEYGADVVATERTFYGNGSNYLGVDPYVPGSLNTTLEFPDGYTAPEFIEVSGYLEIVSLDGVRAPGLVYSSGWYGGVPVVVTAKWGFESTPADVKAAIIEWAINLWRETDPASLKLTNLDGSAVRESVPPRVKRIAQHWAMKAGVAFV
jgi:hypothetical protein